MDDAPARLVARFDQWTLRRAPLELFNGEQAVRLQEQPLQILEALVQAPGQLVTREALSSRLWPDSIVDFEAGLNTSVRKLRAALGDVAEAPRYVETVPRQGYRFIGRVERRDPRPTLDPPAPVAPEMVVTEKLASGMPRRVGNRLAFGLLGVVAVVGVLLVAKRPFAGRAAGAPSRPAVARLAVLPFENLSPDPANAFFAEGMHAEVLTALGGRTRELDVISRTTMMRYRTIPPSVSALARELAATYVLEGTVRREGSAVRVTLQLVDAVADRQVWSRSYQRTLVDAMTLQTQLAADVAEQITTQLPGSRTGHLPAPRTPEAYDEWLKGTLAWQQVGGGGATAQEIERVEAMFTRALALDDTYGAAYADRARVRIARYASRADGSEANLVGARADIEMAQRYAGGTPHVLVRTAQLAFLVDHDLRRALGLIEAAELVGPLDADLLMTKGSFLMSAGRLEDSLAVQAHAAGLDPGNPTIFRFWVANLAAAHRPAEAMRVLKAFDATYPGRLTRGEYLFAFTGSTAAWWEDVRRLGAGGGGNATLSSEFDLLRYERRFADLHSRLAAATSAEFAQHTASGARVGAGLKPVAELRGWERLLAGDASGAAREGSVLAVFVQRQPTAARTDWWRRLLSAESALMTGDPARAIDEARAATRVAGDRTFVESLHIRLLAARVLAWAGEGDEAIALLEALAHGYPGVGPAVIVRDPIFTARLSQHPRWRVLEQALNAELAANQALLR